MTGVFARALLCSLTAACAIACGSGATQTRGRVAGGTGGVANDGGEEAAQGGDAGTSGEPALAITLTGAARNLSGPALGVNGSILGSSAGWQTTPIVDAAAELQPSWVRFIEGGHSEYWDWRHAWTFTNYTAKGATKTPGYDYASYAAAESRIGNATITVLDLVTRPAAPGSTTGVAASYPADSASVLADQTAMVEAEQAAGVDVRFLELGNEVYLQDGQVDKTKIFPTGKDYATEANKWIAALHSRFPKLRLGLSLDNDSLPQAKTRCPSSQTTVERDCAWDSTALATERGADAGILHIYFKSSAAAPSLQDFLALPSTYWSELSAPGSTLSEIQNAKLATWITEFNYDVHDTGLQTFTGSWAHGLGLVSFDLQALADSRVQVIIEHNLYAGYPFGLVLDPSWGHKGKPAVTPNALSAIGVSFQLLAGALKGATVAQAVQVEGGPLLEGQPAVVGIALGQSGQFDHVVVANLSATPVRLDLDSVLGRGFTARVLGPPASGPSAALSDAASELTTATVQAAGSMLSLPAYGLADCHR